MTMTTEVKQHDLEPPLTLYVEDAGQLADLRGVGSWRVVGKMRGVLVLDVVPTVTVDPTDHWKATLVHVWQAGETSTLGDLRVEAEAMWPGARPQTFPGSGYVTVRFVADLG